MIWHRKFNDRQHVGIKVLSIIYSNSTLTNNYRGEISSC